MFILIFFDELLFGCYMYIFVYKYYYLFWYKYYVISRRMIRVVNDKGLLSFSEFINVNI